VSRRQPHRQLRGRRATLPARPLGPAWPPCGNDLEHGMLCACLHDHEDCDGITEPHWAWDCPAGAEP